MRELEGRYHLACLGCFLVRFALRRIGDVAGVDDPEPRIGASRPFRVPGHTGAPMVEARGVRDELLLDRGSDLTLHILRLLSPAADRKTQPPPIENPSDVLRVAMDSADREHRRALGEVNAAFYYGVATPTVLPIERRLAIQLRTTLELSEEAVGIWGPGTIRRRDALYEVWIRLQLCG